MIEFVGVAAAQALSSYLSVTKLHAALATSTTRFVFWAALSDTLRLSTYSSVAVLAVYGHWFSVLVAVAGGVIGNAIAHRQRQDSGEGK